MNYELMSDFEINKAVSKRLGVSVDDEIYLAYQEANKPSVPASQSELTNKWVDYCNNPADAWPIIIENNISINHEIARYKASALVYDVKYERGFNIFVFNSVIGDTSSRAALRAAMIVFLMMNGE